MKKLLMIVLLFCITFAGNEKNKIEIATPVGKPIKSVKNYTVKLYTFYYSNIILGNNDFIDKSYISYSQGSSESDLIVSGSTAEMFNAKYNVLVDNKQYLILFRIDKLSGITETFNLNKITGIGINSKSKCKDVGGNYPTISNYILVSK